jgi:benzoate/toluate 1,2-dioxygenase beta subunit
MTACAIFSTAKHVTSMTGNGMSGWRCTRRTRHSGCRRDDNDELTEDPQREISLIWYGNRTGLEDRVFRIKTERSSASIPDTRTSHNISNIELLEQADGLCKVRFNWHTLSFRYKTVDSYFGSSFYTLDVRGENPLIKAKKVILKNDYVRQVIDVYHL